MDAPVVTNGPAAGKGAMPPSPRARPANRYSGTGDNPYRRAAAPSTVSTVRMTPSSSSSATRPAPAQPLSTMRSIPAMPFSVPITTSTSLARKVSDGPGDASTSSLRTIATIDAPVRVRARVSPSRRSTNGLSGRTSTWPALSPGTSRVKSANRSAIRGRAQDLRERLGLLVGEPQDRLGLVGIIAGVHDEFDVAAAPDDDADAFSVFDIELVAQAHPGQQHLFDVHAVNTR